MDELTEVAAFDAWCVLSNPFHHTTDDGISNRRDWEVWQARAKIEADRQLRQGDASLPVIGSITLSADGLIPSAAHWAALTSQTIPELIETPLVRLSDAQAAIDAVTDDRDSWYQQASDRLDDALRFATERDAVLAVMSAKDDRLKQAEQTPIPESAILHRMKYHYRPAAEENPADWDLYEMDITCNDCIDVLIVRADAIAEANLQAIAEFGELQGGDFESEKI